MGRVVAAAVAAGVLAAVGAVSAVGAAVPSVRFPRDHFGHPAASIEWWYFTALVHDRQGRRYSVFFTLFSSRGVLVPVAQVRDLDSGAVVGQSARLASGRVSSSAVDVRVAGSQLRYLAGTGTWLFAVSGPDLRIVLRQQPDKPYVLNGDGTGVIQQSLAGHSHYYSDTRMHATGTLRLAGKTVAISGESWFDHQWGNYRDDPRAFNWEWFSCRFDNHSELMLYQFLDRMSGRPLARFRTGTLVQPNGTPIAVTAFQATPGKRALTADGRRWPLDWQLTVPGQSLTERIRALFANQLVHTSLLPTFWEGAAHATGTHTGTCFVEISHR